MADTLTYKSKDKDISLDVHVLDHTVWLTQKQMCDLYQKYF